MIAESSRVQQRDTGTKGDDSSNMTYLSGCLSDT